MIFEYHFILDTELIFRYHISRIGDCAFQWNSSPGWHDNGRQIEDDVNIRDDSPRVATALPSSSEPSPGAAKSNFDSRSQGPHEIELYDETGLADAVAIITGRRPEGADEFSMYILLLIDGLASRGAEGVKTVMERSVELTFPFTETFRAALDLYILDKRGLMTGHGTSGDLIRDLIKARS